MTLKPFLTEDDERFWGDDPFELVSKEKLDQKGRALLFYPGQPRHPAGHPQGGQFAKSGGPGDVPSNFSLGPIDPNDEHYSELGVEDAELAWRSSAVDYGDEQDWDTQASLQNYTAGEHSGINALAADRTLGTNNGELLLRSNFGGNSPFDADPWIERREKDIDNLEDLLDGAPPVPDNFRLYRGASGTHFGDTKTGNRFVEPEFTSTSFRSVQADKFIGPNETMLIIDVPKGSGGILPIADFSGFTTEAEVLINRGAVFQIIDRGTNTVHGVDYVHAVFKGYAPDA